MNSNEGKVLVVNRSKERKNKFRKKLENGDISSVENYYESCMFGLQVSMNMVELSQVSVIILVTYCILVVGFTKTDLPSGLHKNKLASRSQSQCKLMYAPHLVPTLYFDAHQQTG